MGHATEFVAMANTLDSTTNELDDKKTKPTMKELEHKNLKSSTARFDKSTAKAFEDKKLKPITTEFGDNMLKLTIKELDDQMLMPTTKEDLVLADLEVTENAQMTEFCVEPELERQAAPLWDPSADDIIEKVCEEAAHAALDKHFPGGFRLWATEQVKAEMTAERG